MGVFVAPGVTWLTRIRRPANSEAITRVIERMAPFVAA
jgi:hypothetical protein